MSSKVVKYNPSFLNDQELIASFVVRYSQLEQVMEVIRENDQGPNQHLLVIGPRGSGKTTLLRRVVAEVRQNEELNSEWFPIPYGEESYEVSSAGEFWLEAFHYLESLTRDSSWGKVYDELLGETDEERLRQRCLGRLLDFADKEGKRLLFVVENLNLMLGDQLEEDDAWALRETLMHEPRIMLLGSATNQFDEIIKHDQAMFELFRLIEFQRLAVPECQKVWYRVSGQDITPEQARAIQILTGGNPRLLTILAVFGTNRSFSSLMDELSLLVDEHTDYFKSNFEALPPKERKVFACLATLWEDSLASDIARAARMSTNQVSALLKRLESRGIVKDAGKEGRRKKYQLAERLYNIYYLMRRGQSRGRVKAVVHFMRQFYGQERVHEAVGVIAREACCMADGQRQEHYRAIKILCDLPEVRDTFSPLRDILPQEFWELSDIPEYIKVVADKEEGEFSSELEKLHAESVNLIFEEQWENAEKMLRKSLDIDQSVAWVWAVLGELLVNRLDQLEEGLECLKQSVVLNPNVAGVWVMLGDFLVNLAEQFDEGVDCLRKSVELAPNEARYWGTLGEALVKDSLHIEEGVKFLRKSLSLDSSLAPVWNVLGDTLINKLGQFEDGEKCLRKSVELDPDDSWAWGSLGSYLVYKVDRLDEGIECLRKSLEIDSESPVTSLMLGDILVDRSDNVDEGIRLLRKAAEVAPNPAIAWGFLGAALADKKKQFEEAMGCFHKAIDLDSANYGYLGALGSLMANKLERPEEGLVYLRKSLELNPDMAMTWGTLGYVMARYLSQPTDAIGYLQKAVDLDQNYGWAWSVLGYVHMLDLNQLEEGCVCLRKVIEIDSGELDDDYLCSKIVAGDVPTTTIEVILNCTDRPDFLLDNVASWMMDAGVYHELNFIELLANEAVEKNEEISRYYGTLARVLSLKGDVDNSLKYITIYFEDPKSVNIETQESTDILTTAAALGYGHEALEILLASKCSEILEPVAVGLQQYLGLDHQAPQEVKEIGEDIVKKIEYWKEWHANR